MVGGPNHQWWYAKWKLGWNVYTLHVRPCTFGTDLHAQLALVDKVSASELSRKFIKSPLLVGSTYTQKCDFPLPPFLPSSNENKLAYFFFLILLTLSVCVCVRNLGECSSSSSNISNSSSSNFISVNALSPTDKKKEKVLFRGCV